MQQLTPDIEDPGTPLGVWAMPIAFFWTLVLVEGSMLVRLFT